VVPRICNSNAIAKDTPNTTTSTLNTTRLGAIYFMGKQGLCHAVRRGDKSRLEAHRGVAMVAYRRTSPRDGR
jgi:hypothetical protein